eukprot:SAG31_NODE_15631_length_745_cov_1.600619_2_plen_68_part_01
MLLVLVMLLVAVLLLLVVVVVLLVLVCWSSELPAARLCFCHLAGRPWHCSQLLRSLPRAPYKLRARRA